MTASGSSPCVTPSDPGRPRSAISARRAGPNPWIGSPDTWRGPEDEETDHELCPVDRSGAARGRLSVLRWNEAGPGAPDAEKHVEPDAAARPLPALHRRGPADSGDLP